MTRRRNANNVLRRAFTLVELLVIIGIIGVMVTVGVVSITSGQGAARVKGATRDIYAAIRHARSNALVTIKPVIITYSTEEADGEPVAKVEIVSAKLFQEATDLSKVQSLSGEPIKGLEPAPQPDDRHELVHIEKKDGTDAAAEQKSEGESVEEILFAPIATEIVKGMRLKVVKGDEELQSVNTGRKTKISVFSNVDYLIGRYKDAKAEAKKKEDGGKEPENGKSVAPKDETQEPVSIVWETNGRVDPHQVWVYADGQQPEDGLLIKIDRFGAAKVLSGDGKDERD